MTEIVDFAVAPGAIDGLVVVTPKQVTDERGTIREVFRRSAFESAGIDIGAFGQINATTSTRGVIRGMHAESMTKLVTVVAGEAFGAYRDLRSDSPTFLTQDTVRLVPGVQVLVPHGVANGFQAVSAECHYVYCFDREWEPGMPGVAFTPIDPDLEIPWPVEIDPDDPSLLSVKDRNATRLDDLRASLATHHGG